MDINTCVETTKNYHTIAYYSHLIPVFITIVLTIFALRNSKFSLLSKIFFLFSLPFCLWLIGDVVLWTSPNYNLVTFFWAPLDYINILYYLLGAYFFAVLVTGKDIKIWQKIVLFVLTLPAIYITVTGLSASFFNQAVCEVNNNDFLTEYKIFIESIVVLFILAIGIFYFKKGEKQKRTQIVTVGITLILFFTTFSITEYISSQTGIYEINLYSLFILPLFLGLIIYSIANLQLFQFRSFGTQLLVYVLLIMIGSQFFFLQSSTDKILTVITFVLSLVFSMFLMRGVKREREARNKIEELANELEQSNEKLKGLDKLKTEFLSLASHQLRSPLTAIKGYSSMLTEGTFGVLEPKQDEAVKRIYTSAQGLVSIVEDLLNVSKIEQGGMKYEFSMTELNKSVTDLYNEMKIPAESKGLELMIDIPKYEKFAVSADSVKLKQVFLNLVDNSIKYTPHGFVKMSLRHEGKNVVFAVSDNGIGISPETLGKLFEKFSRGEGGKLNTGGSGLGLYLAREIARAHKGDIVIESEGLGKGSVFKVVLPAVGAQNQSVVFTS